MRHTRYLEAVRAPRKADRIRSATVLLLAAVTLLLAPNRLPAQRRETEPSNRAEGRVQSRTLRVLTSETPGTYWLGAQLEPVDDVLKAQLRIEHGLAAKLVVPEGPAAKAGFEQHDILLRFNDRAVESVEQLMKLVEQEGGKEVPVRILRGGTQRELTITPAERPSRYAIFDAVPGAAEFHERLKDLPGDGARWLDDNRLRMLFVKPGVMLPGDLLRAEDFPEKLNINVNKQGNEPARITVVYGDQRWEIRDGEFDKLPEEIREHVRRFADGPKQLKVRILRSPGGTADADDGGDAAREKQNGVEIERKVRVLRDFSGIDIEQLNELRRKAHEAGEAVVRPRTAAGERLDEVMRELRHLRREIEMLRKEVAGDRDSANTRSKPTDAQ